MKKIFFLFLSLSCKNSFSQDTSHYDKLLNEFTEAYYYYSAHNPSFNYFENLEKASNAILNFYNPVFRKFKREVRESFKINSDEELFTKATDTVIKGFGQKFLWKGEEALFQKYQKTLSVYNDQICSCISKQWVENMRIDKLSEVVSTCEQAMVKDQVFMNRINVYMINFSTTEKLGMPKYASRYSYQNCQYFNKVMNSILINSAYGNYFSSKRSLQQDIIDSVFLFLSGNKIDSVMQYFPDYRNYIDAIKAAVKVSEKSNTSAIDMTDAQNLTVITKTFITGNKKPELAGQVIYKLQNDPDDFPLILSFDFVPPNKIKNKKEILKGLEFPPPVIQSIKN